MDVDGDVDSQLLQQFGSMATNDKEVLISEFHALLGYELSEANCAFFLDMNNWNLQAAVCAYFEYQQPLTATRIPKMAFVKDMTIGEGESVPPNTRFTKIWKVQNTDDEPWPEGFCLRFVSGMQFGPVDSVAVGALGPGQCADISVEMFSPASVGLHQGQWRMYTPSAVPFGEYIWMILQVDEGGVLAVTQLLSQFGTADSTTPSNNQSHPSRVMDRACGDDTSTAGMGYDSGVGFRSGVSFQSRSTDIAGCGTVTGGMTRHSSLPSSPRCLLPGDRGDFSGGEAGIDRPEHRSRNVLFQTPDNSPSKTITSCPRPQASTQTLLAPFASLGSPSSNLTSTPSDTTFASNTTNTDVDMGL